MKHNHIDFTKCHTITTYSLLYCYYSGRYSTLRFYRFITCMTSVGWFITYCLNLRTPDGLRIHDLTEIEQMCVIQIEYWICYGQHECTVLISTLARLG